MRQTGPMRLLYADSPTPVAPGTETDIDALRALYAWPGGGGVRTNFVATLDGAATGPSGLTGSINNAADKIVFDLNRELCDVVLVGEATADAEGYRPADGPPLIVVSRRCRVPRGFVDPPRDGHVVLVTGSGAEAGNVRAARQQLGDANVWVLGEEDVDLGQVIVALGREGRHNILCEGGPRVHAALLARNLVDEVALTWVPRGIGGAHPRIAHGANFDVQLRVKVLLESDSTLLGLWRVPETSGHN